MTKKIHELSLQDRFNHLLNVMSGERFLKKEGLNNEIPFFICPYDITETTEMHRLQRNLQSQLADRGINVLDINLYDLTVEILKSRAIWDQVIEMEADISKSELLELLQNVLDSAEHLIPAVAQKMSASEFHVMFLTGIGEVFPYLRSHNILNNLQSTAKEQPTVMFFPGHYRSTPNRGTSLDLFGLLKGDNYYRGFNIWEIQP